MTDPRITDSKQNEKASATVSEMQCHQLCTLYGISVKLDAIFDKFNGTNSEDKIKHNEPEFDNMGIEERSAIISNALLVVLDRLDAVLTKL